MKYKCEVCNNECDIHETSEVDSSEFWGSIMNITSNYSVSNCCLDDYWEVEDDE